VRLRRRNAKEEIVGIVAGKTIAFPEKLASFSSAATKWI
jgi:hypothetical protein